MILILSLLAIISLTSSTAPKPSTKIYKYQAFKFPRPPEIPEEHLIVKDFSTFVRNHRRASNITGDKDSNQPIPKNLDKEESNDVYNKTFDIMKQAIYATQDRLKYLQLILDKYENDVSFRAGFIFSKLDQLLEDMRRIYSYTLKQRQVIVKNIICYRHLTKKNIDVTYIVEFMHSFHARNLEALDNFQAQIIQQQEEAQKAIQQQKEAEAAKREEEATTANE